MLPPISDLTRAIDAPNLSGKPKKQTINFYQFFREGESQERNSCSCFTFHDHFNVIKHQTEENSKRITVNSWNLLNKICYVPIKETTAITKLLRKFTTS